jgi:hypothetical protein
MQSKELRGDRWLWIVALTAAAGIATAALFLKPAFAPLPKVGGGFGGAVSELSPGATSESVFRPLNRSRNGPLPYGRGSDLCSVVPRSTAIDIALHHGVSEYHDVTGSHPVAEHGSLARPLAMTFHGSGLWAAVTSLGMDCIGRGSGLTGRVLGRLDVPPGPRGPTF